MKKKLLFSFNDTENNVYVCGGGGKKKKAGTQRSVIFQAFSSYL